MILESAPGLTSRAYDMTSVNEADHSFSTKPDGERMICGLSHCLNYIVAVID